MHTGFTISVVASVLVQTTGNGLDTGFNFAAMPKRMIVLNISYGRCMKVNSKLKIGEDDQEFKTFKDLGFQAIAGSL